jgi:hypothetical protein
MATTTYYLERLDEGSGRVLVAYDVRLSLVVTDLFFDPTEHTHGRVVDIASPTGADLFHHNESAEPNGSHRSGWGVSFRQDSAAYRVWCDSEVDALTLLENLAPTTDDACSGTLLAEVQESTLSDAQTPWSQVATPRCEEPASQTEGPPVKKRRGSLAASPRRGTQDLRPSELAWQRLRARLHEAFGVESDISSNSLYVAVPLQSLAFELVRQYPGTPSVCHVLVGRVTLGAARRKRAGLVVRGL